MTTPAARRRAALMTEAAAIVTRLLDGADQETAAAAVNHAARTCPALNAMIEHLTTHPEALRSSSSNGPNSITKLAQALHARGVAGVVVPGCAVCGRVVRELRRVDGKGGLCQGCYLDTRRRACTQCGKVARIVSSKDGQSTCHACYGRDPDRHEPCAGCGELRRVAHRDDQGRPRCVRCYPRPKRQCSSCGQVAETTAFTEAGPVCPRCYTSVAPKRECGRCGRVRSISRRATDHTPDLCYSCDPGPQDTCSRCARFTTRAGYQGGLPVCPRCYQHPLHRCDFCGELGRITARWPSGAICSACYPRVRATPRTCPGCEQSRTLNAVDGQGQPVCAECAGAGTSYRCIRCGGPSDGYVRDRCAPCALRDRLDVLLSNSDGSVHPALRGVHAALSEWRNPRSVLTWLDRSDGATMLADLAQKNGGISHDDLDSYPRNRVTNYLRQALVHAGALPHRDEHVEQVETWLDEFLREQPPAHSQLLRPFANWVVLRRARQRSRRRPTTEATASWARQRIRAAADLLNYLDDRSQDLSSLDQRTLDQWLAAGRSTRHTVRDFIIWAARQRLARPLTVPHRQVIGPEQPLADDDRWQQLRQCIRNPDMPLRLRVAGSLVLLYGHPVSRIVALRTHHVDKSDDGVYLVIGQHRALLPPALGMLMIQLRDSAPPASIFGASASASAPDWLLPGLVPGQHIADNYLVRLLNGIGIRTRTARNSALISLAGDLPAPILADLLGLHINTAVRWVRRSKRDWASYIEARAESLVDDLHSAGPSSSAVTSAVTAPRAERAGSDN